MATRHHMTLKLRQVSDKGYYRVNQLPVQFALTQFPNPHHQETFGNQQCLKFCSITQLL